ncbi:response regulator [uncultured Cohaesibacter sp.]|uniref:response regulator n=1 Tax=uncultured Cohaesibacter sp. TaxID=1002546 RepID=UPI0029C9994D|nr:response regulator [uncultured Cohaesibacter sp.]
MNDHEKGWHIVIVEDEPSLASIIQDYLTQAGMTSEILNEGRHAVERILAVDPDLVVLDVMLPGKDGLTICREVRAVSDVPIILETARVEELDRLLGLELGADDYVCKPFSPRELVARVKAILRRQERLLRQSQAEAQDDDTAAGYLRIDEERWAATYMGKDLSLTRREFQLLALLFKRPGRVFSRAQLVELAFPDDSDVFDRVIDTHVKNIRTKLRKISDEADIIRSVYGVGYSYEEPDLAS